jgi:APA family basic amino acid/polyamine antiporter
VLPAVFVLSAAVVLYSSFAGNLQGSLIGSLLILLGLPLYEWIRRAYGKRAAHAAGA